MTLEMKTQPATDRPKTAIDFYYLYTYVLQISA